MTEIYSVLKSDHQLLKSQLHELVSIHQDSPRRTDLIQEIRDNLIPHARAEEAVFYNSLRSVALLKDDIMHTYREHMEVETYLRTLQMTESIDVAWKVVARRLKISVEKHLEEEEKVIFTLAQQVLTPLESQQMAKSFLRLKARIRKENVVGTTLDMLANLIPPRYSRAFRTSYHMDL